MSCSKCYRKLQRGFISFTCAWCNDDNAVGVGANDYPGDDVSGAQSVTEKVSDLAQNGVPVNNNQCDSGQ
ncbi:hypothetical protein YC2023_043198 [Brassica napus]